MHKIFYTYLHCKPNGDPFYIGKGSGGRYKEFKCGRNNHYLKIITKYGKENILVYKFECDSEQQAFNDEIQQISQIRKEGFQLVNYSNGGEGASGHKHSEETKIKLSLIAKNISEETRYKMSISHKGKKLPHEQRAKISESNKGRIMSEETRKKISLTLTGTKRDPAIGRKISITKRNKKGLP